MKTRHEFAIVVGTIAAYLLAHAAMAGYAVYLAHEVLRNPVGVGPSELYVSEIEENYYLVVSLFVVVSVLGTLGVITCAGLIRGSTWARNLWSVTSAAIVAAIAIAVFYAHVPVAHYSFELGMVVLSWWCALQFGRNGSKG